VISRRAPMLIRPAIGDTDPIRSRRPTPDGQFSGNILDEAMRPLSASKIAPAPSRERRFRSFPASPRQAP
jgi:hypothetical protein